ncbi:hypothetical protein [Pseudochelatococcus contaminans]|uniref:Uncharacterized protein n=1 Tax=Pseudochelatococcus contaminans TaxID=1538103 RepID=A0A7W6EH62_9HYPH|nr:hypothetical protein [Pseudochelatococcus contaminans]MBB3809885.1 hypothetical protein [Pseudochelatococcus contaminans]
MRKARTSFALFALAIASLTSTPHVQAQSNGAPAAIPITPSLPMEGRTFSDRPNVLPGVLEGGNGSVHSLSLTATLADSEMPIQSGLTWRIYAINADGTPVLASELEEATPRQILPQGNYIVHVSYGFTSAIARVALRADSITRLAIAAGGLRVTGMIGTEPIPDEDLTYSVYLPDQNDPEARLVVANIASGTILRLPEGDYHVVSTYGKANAISRTDLSVEVGKVTDATISHHGARVTLKLVAMEGAEAFAGTAFSILTPGGDTIHEEIGAFPSLILAEGDYVVVARHEGQVYSREFTVQSGTDAAIEIVGSQ